MNTSGTGYTIAFATAVCVICAVFVAGSAVGLSERQERNATLDRQAKVLSVAGVLEHEPSAAEISQLFEERIEAHVVDLATGTFVEDVDANSFDQQRAVRDPATSHEAEANLAGIARLPEQALVYFVKDGEETTRIILPVEGKGLWSTLYGFVALSADQQTIEGLVFYQHGETPGLGGEVDNPRWRALWEGRRPFDENWDPVIAVVKGAAGSVADDPTHVDGLSGATLTSRGVTHLLQFWLGEQGFGPTLATLRAQEETP